MLQDLDNDIFGNKRERTKRIRAFEAAWARLQSDTPGWALDPLDQQFEVELLNWLRFHKAMLIGELVPEALRYLRNNPTCAELDAFDHVIVDEYQDLNKAEQILLDLLAATGDFALVGDEDQSIYSFRYARPEGIIDFAITHPKTHDENLVECRRCPTKVVTMANHLIRQNHLSEPVVRLSPKPDNLDGDVHIVQWHSLQEEAEGFAQFVEYLISARGYSPSEILILSPRRIIGYGIRDALVARNIATHSFYHEEALEEDDAQRAFALLALLVNKEDRVALRFWLGYGSPSWLEGEYRTLRTYCEQSGMSPWRALEQIVSGNLAIKRVNTVVSRFKELLTELSALEPLTGNALVDKLFPEVQPWATPLREASSFVVTDKTDADELLDKLRTAIAQPEIPQSGNFVRVMSLHKSKGLTSKVVIVVGCIDGLIPFYDSDATPEEQQALLQEQRRLFYVAITRPTEALILSSVRNLKPKIAYKLGARLHGKGGQFGVTIASRFINELGPSAPPAKAGSMWQQRGYV